MSAYHIEAEIASLYTTPASYDATDWAAILSSYERLRLIRSSPIDELNRSIVVERIDGPQAALRMLDELSTNYLITSFNLYYVARAHFLEKLGRRAEAAESFRRASELTKNQAVRTFIEGRLAEQTDPGKFS